jgi:hypothetical protein
MAEYLLINHGKGTTEGWDAFFKMLCDNDHLIGGSSLDHGISVKNGTFSEAVLKTVTGYIVFQAKDFETAKNIALQCPVQQSGGVVELFTLVPS